MRALWTTLLVAACAGPTPAEKRVPRSAEPQVQPAPATLRRLTRDEYRNTVADLLGDDLVLPSSLEPDVEVEGLLHVGAGQTALSPLGVEQYESAAWLLAGQAVQDLVSCDPADEACVEGFVRDFGRLAWRRALTTDEVDVLLDVASTAAGTLGDPWAGPEYALAALLQSPHFLYRVELGEGGRFEGTELATRLSYLLWAGPPDAALLDAAEAGALEDDEALRAEVRRMLDDPRARRGLRLFFDEYLGLHALDSLTKDPTVFVNASDTLGQSAREETLLGIEHLALEGGDYRDLLVTRTTFVDRQLAAIYEVQAPEREGFGRVELPAGGPRAGLLGQVAFLARLAHPVSTSVTRRGAWVQTKLLCREIPPPPADVDTSIPEPSAEAETMRERVAVHLEDPACASCHQLTDPIGLGLEQFDGIGRFRTHEGSAPIDPSGEVDGEPYADALGLAALLRTHDDLPHCLAETWLAYAQGHPLAAGEAELAAWHTEGFAGHGHELLWLIEDLVTSETFRTATVEAR